MRIRLEIVGVVGLLWGCSSGSVGPAGASPGLDAGGNPASDASTPPSGPEGDDATVADDGGSGVVGPADAGPVDYDQVAPTPPASWINVTGAALPKLTSECGNVSAVVSDPRADRLIVGIALNGLFASTDGAKTWNPIGAGGDAIKNRMSSIVFDPATAGTFWESGIYGWETNTAGVFMTTTNGASFKGLADLMTASGGNDTNDSVSIDFSDPKRKTMLAGSHEVTGKLYLSIDSGTTWTDIGSKLPSGLGFCTSTLVLDANTLIVGCAASYSNAAGAIIRSTDGGKSFAKVASSGVSFQPLQASDGTLYFAAEGGGIEKSADQGKTWSLVTPSGTAGTVPPFELPDGRIVDAQQKDVVVSADEAAHWTKITTMPFLANGLTYSPFRRAFYASYSTCDTTVPSDGIAQFGWDYQ
jgi:photosystem II stability/assembly factor-like uncharacterized protein